MMSEHMVSRQEVKTAKRFATLLPEWNVCWDRPKPTSTGDPSGFVNSNTMDEWLSKNIFGETD